MFSGYKQNQSFVYDVLLATEQYLYKREGRDHALDKLNEWDEGDLYRLVAAAASMWTLKKTLVTKRPQTDASASPWNCLCTAGGSPPSLWFVASL